MADAAAWWMAGQLRHEETGKLLEEENFEEALRNANVALLPTTVPSFFFLPSFIHLFTHSFIPAPQIPNHIRDLFKQANCSNIHSEVPFYSFSTSLSFLPPPPLLLHVTTSLSPTTPLPHITISLPSTTLQSKPFWIMLRALKDYVDETGVMLLASPSLFLLFFLFLSILMFFLLLIIFIIIFFILLIPLGQGACPYQATFQT